MHKEVVYETGPDGVMSLAGHDVRELVKEYGSPLIVMLEDVVRWNCRAYRKQIEHYHESRVYYAAKAFLTTGFCRIIEEEGLGLDVVSWGELHTALSAGFPPDRILMHGNAKTVQDLRLALEAGVGRIVIDNMEEIDRLSALAAEMKKEAKVQVRVTPGVKPSTHRYVQTGQQDSKFGFNLEGGTAEEAVRKVMAAPGLELVGIHCHIGSQIFALKPFRIAVRVMMEFYAHVQKNLKAPILELNMGGGLGIRYNHDDHPPTVDEHLTNLCQTVQDAAKELGVEPPVLLDEPGRSIVGRAGVTLYTVQSTKKIEGVRNYVSVDGGMTDNPRYALYEARHQVLAAIRMNTTANQLWSVSGRCCESGDMIVHDVSLPEVAVGDLLAVLEAGAYTYSMASNYNRLAKPAVVLAAPGRVDLLAARETADDLIRLDRIPKWIERKDS